MSRVKNSTTIMETKATEPATNLANESEPARYLGVELDFFEAHLPELLQHDEGKVALISGEELLVLNTWEAAAEQGYLKFGSHPFLVREILSVQPDNVTTRVVCPQ